MIMQNEMNENKIYVRLSNKTLKKMFRDRELYVMLIPALVVTLVFRYFAMPGVVIAFQDFSIYKGLFGSEWVGFENIKKIFAQPQVIGSIWNTLKISLLKLLITFPAPIILALLINEIKSTVFKRIVQTTSYLPHFLSWISVVGIVQLLFSKNGLINDARMFLGVEDRISFLAEQSYFIWFVIGTMLWKEWGSFASDMMYGSSLK